MSSNALNQNACSEELLCPPFLEHKQNALKPKVIKLSGSSTHIPTKKRVAVYARVSVDSPELLQSLSNQVSHYNAYIQKNPIWEYAGVYADVGISGTSIKNRSEFQRLLTDCEKGHIDIILTKSISRFARNTVDLLKVIRRLKALGVSVQFERENLDTLSADGELMVAILASYAQEESLSISENVKWGIRKRFAQGQFLAYNMYGYQWVDDHFEIVEEEAQAVRFMYQSFANGMLLTEISEALANQGILNRKGLPFAKSSISRILDQEKYRGFSILQRTFTDNHITHTKQINRGQLPRFVVQGTHPVIIDEDLHQAVEAERVRRREKGVVRWRRGTCFTGIITCGHCGSTLTYTPGSSTGKLTPFQQGSYRCSNKRANGPKACRAKNLAVYALRQICCAHIAPLAGASTDDAFDEEWITNVVDHIISFGDTLEFHLQSKEVLATPYKSTARADAQAHRQAMAKQSNNKEVSI